MQIVTFCNKLSLVGGYTHTLCFKSPAKNNDPKDEFVKDKLKLRCLKKEIPIV